MSIEIRITPGELANIVRRCKNSRLFLKTNYEARLSGRYCYEKNPVAEQTDRLYRIRILDVVESLARREMERLKPDPAPCEDAWHRLKELARERAAAGIELREDSRLEDDLGFDPLDKAEFIIDVEEEWEVAIAEDEAEGIETLGDVGRLVTRKLKEEGR